MHTHTHKKHRCADAKQTVHFRQMWFCCIFRLGISYLITRNFSVYKRTKNAEMKQKITKKKNFVSMKFRAIAGALLIRNENLTIWNTWLSIRKERKNRRFEKNIAISREYKKNRKQFQKKRRNTFFWTTN